jgi:hypothetical protein
MCTGEAEHFGGDQVSFPQKTRFWKMTELLRLCILLPWDVTYHQRRLLEMLKQLVWGCMHGTQ